MTERGVRVTEVSIWCCESCQGPIGDHLAGLIIVNPTGRSRDYWGFCDACMERVMDAIKDLVPGV